MQVFIEDLMGKKVVTVSVNNWAVSHAPDDPPQLPQLLAYGLPTYTRSWQGTYNRVYNTDTK